MGRGAPAGQVQQDGGWEALAQHPPVPTGDYTCSAHVTWSS